MTEHPFVQNLCESLNVTGIWDLVHSAKDYDSDSIVGIAAARVWSDCSNLQKACSDLDVEAKRIQNALDHFKIYANDPDKYVESVQSAAMRYEAASIYRDRSASSLRFSIAVLQKALIAG